MFIVTTKEPLRKAIQRARELHPHVHIVGFGEYLALQLIERAPEILDFSQAVIVNRQMLACAHRSITRANNLLHDVESINELNHEDFFDLMKLLLIRRSDFESRAQFS